MPAETTDSIPREPGSYALWLNLIQEKTIRVGRLGVCTFAAGDYVYLGSARGPGGLRARLGRHLRGNGKTHWHIDFLRKVADVHGFSYIIRRGDSRNASMECTWSQKIAAFPGTTIPAPGFGASDCRSGCRAHLVQIPDDDLLLSSCEVNLIFGEWTIISPR